MKHKQLVAVVTASVASGVGMYMLGRATSPSTSTDYCDAMVIPDAAIDALIDTPPDANINAPWAMHVIKAPNPLAGADGTSFFSDSTGALYVGTAWEGSAQATVSLYPGAGLASQPWPTTIFTPLVPGAEDVGGGDLDGDGVADVAIAQSGGFKLAVSFHDPAGWTSITTITASSGVQRYLRSIVADIDHDGNNDIVACGYSANPNPYLEYWTSLTPRIMSSWQRHIISSVGWCQEIVARDFNGDGWIDIGISDRKGPLRGTSWWENKLATGGAWANHTIGYPPQSAQSYNTRFAWFEGTSPRLVIDGAAQDPPSTCNNMITIHRSDDGITWTHQNIPPPTNFGCYHAATYDDFNDDGRKDIALAATQAQGDLSGVVVLLDDGRSGWTRVEVSGPPGTKYDNIVSRDVNGDGMKDLVTSEQGIDQPPDQQLGVVWYENPF